MLQLRLFGGVRLEDASGSIGGRAAQKRRLALLAVLASSPGAVTREKVIGLLWPDHGDERARHLLSTALYDLRKELGDEILLTEGGALELNDRVVRSDVEEFERAVAAGELERAIELHEGPFLDGFFLADAPEFERWAEAERERHAWTLRRALQDKAERHAAAGDQRSAAAVWRRLAVDDPANTRVALGYMRALAASGDRAAALRFAGVHTALLREEYEAEPDPEVLALVEKLRDEPEGVAADAAAPTVPALDPVQEPDAVEIAATTPVAAPASASAPPTPPPSPGTPPPPELATPSRPPRRRRAGLLAAALLLGAVLALGALGVWLSTAGSRASGGPAIEIAVLPLRNVSDEPGTDYFADGLTEEILNALSHVDRLRVTARTSVFGFRDSPLDVREVARQLGVQYVVEGSVRKDGERLRIGVSLVDALSGRRLWTQAYDRRMTSIFELQEEIAHAVVAALSPRLGVGEEPLVRTTTRDPDAYSSYLRGRVHWYARTPRDLQLALGSFEEAVGRDPRYALAYAAIADVYNLMGAYDYGMMAPRDAYPRAREAAERALVLEPDLPEAHAALANVHFNYHWDRATAERLYRRAIALRPGYVEAKHWYSLLLTAAGRHEEAMEQILDARELDPRSPVIQTSLGRQYYFQRDYPRALREYQGALALDSTFALAYVGMGIVQAVAGNASAALDAYGRAERLYGQPNPLVMGLRGHALGRLGEVEGARRIYQQLAAVREGRHVPAHYLAVVALGMGENDAGMRWLEQLLIERSGGLQYIGVDPMVDPVRERPSFVRLLEAVSVPGNAPRLD
jgi:TolB-like protein/DNA-binding SARP family transcriptional activator/Flp pilus assembly protein TadD